MNRRKDKLYMITSMVIFGTLGPFVRGIGVSSGELALYRAVLALVLIGAYLAITKKELPVKEMKRELLLLCVSGVAIGINWILLFEAYKYTTVSVATLSYYFAPVIVTAVSPLLFKEKMTAKQFVCFVMSTIGLVFITGIGDLEQSRDHLAGIGFGIAAAVFYASVMLMNKYIKGIDGICRTFFQFCAAVITLIPYVALTGGVHILDLDIAGWINLLIVGFVHTGITYCMYFSAVQKLPGQETAILSYIDPLIAVVISVLLLQEELNSLQAIGGVLILGFTLWNDLPGRKRNI